MSRSQLRKSLLDSAGNIRQSATVYVYEPGTTTPIAATMYDAASGGSARANPLNADANGEVFFYLDTAQLVDLYIVAGGVSRTVPSVPVAGVDATAHAAVTAGSGISLSGQVVSAMRTATLYVAANNASTAEKAGADYLCNGTADDEQINEAYADLPSTGGLVVPSSGTFNVAGTMTPKSYTTLRGQGRSTIFKAAANLNDEMFALAANTTEHVTLEDFDLDGNKANQASGIGILIDNTGGSASFVHDIDSHHRLRNLFVYDCKDDGIKLVSTGGTMAAILHMIEVYKCDGNGFNILSPDNMLAQCIAGNNGLRGYTLGNDSGNSNLTQCKAFGSGQLVAASGQGFKSIGTRTQMMCCEAQDNLDVGFEAGWTDQFYGLCLADSNGQIGTPRPGLLIKAGGDRCRATGFVGMDRNVGGNRKQSYALEIESGALNVNVLGGGAHNNLTGAVLKNEATAKIVAFEGYADVFATGAAHTVDELITYLQGLGLAAQS